MNYAEEDNNIRYYNDKLKTAKSMGYDYVSEAWHRLREEGLNNGQIGSYFGMTKAGIHAKLKKMNVPQLSVGGRNFFKLTEDKVRQIRFGKEPYKFYMEKFDISYTTIRDIRINRTWKMVTEFN